jgi:hypothetical protein
MIHFGVTTATLLPAMRTDGATVIGLDWRTPLDEGWARVGHHLAVQGNLDPVALFAPRDVLEAKALDVLRRAGTRPGHIFNLGHGFSRVLHSTTRSGSPNACAKRARACAKASLPSQPSRERGHEDDTDRRPAARLRHAGHSGSGRALFPPHPRRASPSPEAVEHLRHRYELVGGRTPLLAITTDTARGLQAALDRRAPGEYRTYVAMKHWHPYIADVIPRIAADGVRRLIVLVLAPHYSRMSIGGYRQYVDQANAGLDTPLDVTFVESWHLQPEFIAMMSARVQEGLATFAGADRADTCVLFSAHSLPVRIRTWADPYEAQLACELRGAWPKHAGSVNGASPGRAPATTGEPWLGPDIVDYPRSAARGRCGQRRLGADRLRVRAPRSAVRHRSRGGAQGDRAGHDASPAPHAERDARAHRGARRARRRCGARPAAADPWRPRRPAP